jgi:hypothetical protein
MSEYREDRPMNCNGFLKKTLQRRRELKKYVQIYLLIGTPGCSLLRGGLERKVIFTLVKKRR